MQKIIKSLIVLLFIFTLLVFYNSLNRETNYSTDYLVGNKLAKISLKSFHDNKIYTSEDFKKSRYTLINFWASWCAPCKEEMPSLDSLQSNKDLNNLQIFPINVGQDSEKKAKDFFEELDIKTLNIYFDTTITLAKKFQLRGIPTTILISKDGYEFARIIGSIDFESQKFIKWLSKYN